MLGRIETWLAPTDSFSIPPRNRAFWQDRGLGSRNRPFSLKIPGVMAQRAVVRDNRVVEVGRRQPNRLVLSVAG